MMGLVRRDTALLLRDLRLSASSWLNSFLELSGQKSHSKSVPTAEPMRRSVSEAALAQPEDPLSTDPLKSLTLHDLSLRGSTGTSDASELSLSAETLGPSTPSDVNFLVGPDAGAQDDSNTKNRGVSAAFPEGFHPRRASQGPTRMPLYSSPIAKNPFMSPLLAPDSMLQTLPPVHIVVSTTKGPRTREVGRVARRGAWERAPVGVEDGGVGRSEARPEGGGVPPGGGAWNRRTEGSQVCHFLLPSC